MDIITALLFGIPVVLGLLAVYLTIHIFASPAIPERKEPRVYVSDTRIVAKPPTPLIVTTRPVITTIQRHVERPDIIAGRQILKDRQTTQPTKTIAIEEDSMLAVSTVLETMEHMSHNDRHSSHVATPEPSYHHTHADHHRGHESSSYDHSHSSHHAPSYDPPSYDHSSHTSHDHGHSSYDSGSSFSSDSGSSSW